MWIGMGVFRVEHLLRTEIDRAWDDEQLLKLKKDFEAARSEGVQELNGTPMGNFVDKIKDVDLTDGVLSGIFRTAIG
jgi:hypothetical protein